MVHVKCKKTKQQQQKNNKKNSNLLTKKQKERKKAKAPEKFEVVICFVLFSNTCSFIVH